MSSNVKDVIYSVYRIRMSDYRIISADENFEKLTGYTEKDYRENQLKHTDLIPAEDIVEYIRKDDADTQEPERKYTGTPSGEKEWRYHCSFLLWKNLQR